MKKKKQFTYCSFQHLKKCVLHSFCGLLLSCHKISCYWTIIVTLYCKPENMPHHINFILSNLHC